MKEKIQMTETKKQKEYMEGNMYRERRRCDWWIKSCPVAAWGCRGGVGEDEHKKNKARGGEWEQEMIKKVRPKQVKRREKKTGWVRKSTSNRRDPVKVFWMEKQNSEVLHPYLPAA